MSNNGVIREGLKISQLTELSQADPDMQFLIAYRGKNYRIGLGDMLSIVDKPTAESIGLGNVDNTADMDKPVSTQTALALDNKADKIHGHSIDAVNQLRESLDGKANRSHGHSPDDIDGLNLILSTKADSGEITRLDGRIDTTKNELMQVVNEKAPLVHTHDEFPIIQQAIDYLTLYKSDVSHTHTEFQLLSDILARKADIVHTHEEFTAFIQLINGLNESKANKIHTHNIDSVNGLPEILATKATLEQLYQKADIDHRHATSEIDGLQDIISNLALKNHSHNIGGINGLSEILDSKLSIDVFNQLWNQLPDFTELNERIDSKLNTEIFLQYAEAIEERLSGLVTREELNERLDELVSTAGNVRFTQAEW